MNYSMVNYREMVEVSLTFTITGKILVDFSSRFSRNWKHCIWQTCYILSSFYICTQTIKSAGSLSKLTILGVSIDTCLQILSIDSINTWYRSIPTGVSPLACRHSKQQYHMGKCHVMWWLHEKCFTLAPRSTNCFLKEADENSCLHWPSFTILPGALFKVIQYFK